MSGVDTRPTATTIHVGPADIFGLPSHSLWASFIGPLAPREFACLASLRHRSPLAATAGAVAKAVKTGVLTFGEPGLSGRLAAGLATHLARAQWRALSVSSHRCPHTEVVGGAIVYRRSDDGAPVAWLQLGAFRVELCEDGVSVLVPNLDWAVESALAGYVTP